MKISHISEGTTPSHLTWSSRSPLKPPNTTKRFSVLAKSFAWTSLTAKSVTPSWRSATPAV